MFWCLLGIVTENFFPFKHQTKNKNINVNLFISWFTHILFDLIVSNGSESSRWYISWLCFCRMTIPWRFMSNWKFMCKKKLFNRLNCDNSIFVDCFYFYSVWNFNKANKILPFACKCSRDIHFSDEEKQITFTSRITAANKWLERVKDEIFPFFSFIACYRVERAITFRKQTIEL